MSEGPPTNFYSADFYCAVTFLHLDLGVPITQWLRVPTNFYSADFFCTYNCLEGPDYLATPYILHTNIPSILNPNWSQY